MDHTITSMDFHYLHEKEEKSCERVTAIQNYNGLLAKDFHQPAN